MNAPRKRREVLINDEDGTYQLRLYDSSVDTTDDLAGMFEPGRYLGIAWNMSEDQDDKYLCNGEFTVDREGAEQMIAFLTSWLMTRPK